MIGLVRKCFNGSNRTFTTVNCRLRMDFYNCPHTRSVGPPLLSCLSQNANVDTRTNIKKKINTDQTTFYVRDDEARTNRKVFGSD